MLIMMVMIMIMIKTMLMMRMRGRCVVLSGRGVLCLVVQGRGGAHPRRRRLGRGPGTRGRRALVRGGMQGDHRL
jgi:hypothetical protein